MTPNSYRNQPLRCCGTCQHNVNVYGIMAPVCGFGEMLHAGSFQEDLEHEQDKYSSDGGNSFSKGKFIDQWLKGRRVYDFSICDEYKKLGADC